MTLQGLKSKGLGSTKDGSSGAADGCFMTLRAPVVRARAGGMMP